MMLNSHSLKVLSRLKINIFWDGKVNLQDPVFVSSRMNTVHKMEDAHKVGYSQNLGQSSLRQVPKTDHGRLGNPGSHLKVALP